MALNRLEALRKSIYSCKRCSSCRQWDWYDKRLPGFEEGLTKTGFKICPVFNHTSGFQSDSPKGKMRIAEGIIDGKLHLNDEIRDKIFQCTMCGNCTEHCPQNRQGKLEPDKVILVMRAYFLKNGFSLPQGLKDQQRTGPHNRLITEKWVPKLKAEQGKNKNNYQLAYFPGCTVDSMVSRNYPEIARSFVALLNNSEVEFGVVRDGWCCGYPQMVSGQNRVFETLARNNLKAMKEIGVRKLVLTCPACYLMFKQVYPEVLGDDWDVEVVHGVDLLAELIIKGELKLKVPIKKVVTWHDPCELGRKSGIYDPPRQIINSIPGLELREMPRNRENAECCGGGGGVKTSNADLSIRIALDRLREAEETGADELITMCPLCEWNFDDAIKRSSSQLKVNDLTMLVAKSAGIEIV